jgi:hypothetical protein
MHTASFTTTTTFALLVPVAASLTPLMLQIALRYFLYAATVAIVLLWSSHGSVAKPLLLVIGLVWGRDILSHYLVIAFPIAFNVICKVSRLRDCALCDVCSCCWRTTVSDN